LIRSKEELQYQLYIAKVGEVNRKKSYLVNNLKNLTEEEKKALVNEIQVEQLEIENDENQMFISLA